MSYKYDEYIVAHKANVIKGYDWLKGNLPEVFKGTQEFVDLDLQIYDHDDSKSRSDEYHAYDAYFYGNNRSYQVVQDFNKAWLLHIHRNPHHWQYWILVHDDPIEDTIIEMPLNYVIEMICDWWTFSWAKENLYEIFGWYEERKEYIRLNPRTRKTVEDILGQIKAKLDELNQDGENN